MDCMASETPPVPSTLCATMPRLLPGTLLRHLQASSSMEQSDNLSSPSTVVTFPPYVMLIRQRFMVKMSRCTMMGLAVAIQHNRWSILHSSMPVCTRLPCPDYVQVPWYELLLMCPTSILRL